MFSGFVFFSFFTHFAMIITEYTIELYKNEWNSSKEVAYDTKMVQ